MRPDISARAGNDHQDRVLARVVRAATRSALTADGTPDSAMSGCAHLVYACDPDLADVRTPSQASTMVPWHGRQTMEIEDDSNPEDDA